MLLLWWPFLEGATPVMALVGIWFAAFDNLVPPTFAAAFATLYLYFSIYEFKSDYTKVGNFLACASCSFLLWFEEILALIRLFGVFDICICYYLYVTAVFLTSFFES